MKHRLFHDSGLLGLKAQEQGAKPRQPAVLLAHGHYPCQHPCHYLDGSQLGSVFGAKKKKGRARKTAFEGSRKQGHQQKGDAKSVLLWYTLGLDKHGACRAAMLLLCTLCTRPAPNAATMWCTVPRRGGTDSRSSRGYSDSWGKDTDKLEAPSCLSRCHSSVCSRPEGTAAVTSDPLDLAAPRISDSVQMSPL